MNEENSSNSKKRQLYVLVGVLIVASIVFRIIGGYHFEQTAILFIGIPALLTLLMIKYSKTPKSAYGVVFRTITIFLLMSSILLGEGTVCVLFAAPIFYGIAALIVFITERTKKNNDSKLKAIVVLPIILILAQPMDFVGEAELQTVETTTTINNEVSLEAFNKSPDFLKNYPVFFKLGFPKPIDIAGSGVNIGDTRNIQFESSTKGIGTLSLEIIESSDSSITFKPTSDKTHINHWLTWEQMTVEIFKTSTNETKIKWTSEYRCDLGPSWYFKPLERKAVQIMNRHLIDAYFN